MCTVIVESLSFHLAGLLFWKQNLSIVEDMHKTFFECNDRLSDSLVDLVTTRSFDAAGMVLSSVIIQISHIMSVVGRQPQWEMWLGLMYV